MPQRRAATPVAFVTATNHHMMGVDVSGHRADTSPDLVLQGLWLEAWGAMPSLVNTISVITQCLEVRGSATLSTGVGA